MKMLYLFTTDPHLYTSDKKEKFSQLSDLGSLFQHSPLQGEKNSTESCSVRSCFPEQLCCAQQVQYNTIR